MGAGVYGGFGNTKGAEGNIHYLPNDYNTKATKEKTANYSFGYNNSNANNKINANRKWKGYTQKNMLKKYDKVRTLVEKESFPIGSVGVVMGVNLSELSCEVELWDEDGNSVDVVTYLFDELEAIDR